MSEEIINNKFVLDSFEWSFSRINSYHTCKRMFYKTYIQCLDKSQNFFAEFGSFFHSLFERYYKKELEFFELSDEYVKGYDKNIKSPAPPNKYVDLSKKYYDAGKSYVDKFEGLFDDCEILGVEEELKINIGGYTFIGYIDLILRDKLGIIICDHKSKAAFKSKKEKDEYLIQLYLYSIHIYEKYGEWPYLLVFNMFRINEIIEEPFDESKVESAKQWVIDTIAEIYKDIEFKTNQSNFFCDNICGVGAHCNCSSKFLG